MLADAFAEAQASYATDAFADALEQYSMLYGVAVFARLALICVWFLIVQTLRSSSTLKTALIICIALRADSNLNSLQVRSYPIDPLSSFLITDCDWFVCSMCDISIGRNDIRR